MRHFRQHSMLRGIGLAALLLSLLAFAVACGSDDDDEQPESEATETSTTTATGTGTSPSGTAEASETSATTATSKASPSAESGENPFAGVTGIVDPENHDWPREIEAMNGTVTIEAKPERLLSLSLGFDEMLFALVPRDRIVAVGTATQNPDYSNVADISAGLPPAEREPEAVVAHEPDLVFAAPYHEASLVDAMENTELTVVQVEQHNDAEGRINDILLLGYMIGEEDRALELAAEVQARHEELIAVTQSKPEAERPRVISMTSYSGELYTAGANSTEGSIIEEAGGFNPAAEAGLEGNPRTSLESIIAMEPEVIIIPQAAGGEEFRDELFSNPVMAEVPAIANDAVYIVPSRFFTTLSFWNLRGAEELAAILWPDDFAGVEFQPFSGLDGVS